MNQNGPPSERRPRRAQPQKRSLFLPLFLLGIFLVLVAGIAFFAFFAMALKPTKPIRVAAKSVLVLNVMGGVPEYAPPTPLNVLLDRRPLVFMDYLHMVNTARVDDRIEGILMNVGPSTLNWAQHQELRKVLEDFKKSGKWIISFGEIWQDQEYYLASVANEVFMVPEGILLLDGLMARTTFYGDLFEEYGIRVHVEAVGEYKSFADSFTRNDMSIPHRESMTVLLEGIEGQVVDAIAESRNVEKEQLEETISGALYELNVAIEKGILDGVVYEDELHGKISQRLNLKGQEKVRLIDGDNYLLSRSPFGKGGPDKIALIYAVGSIQSGEAQQGAFGGSVIASETFIRNLKAARSNPNVKAIVLRIDSPGGSSLASDIMWREIKKTTEMGIPVIASMGGVAASGGYYMAMACDKIVAEPTTITGSVGVVSMRVDFEMLYKRFLVNVEVVKTGESADFFDPHRGLSEEEVTSLRRRAQQAYKNFVQKAADSRGVDYESFESFAKGRVWNGIDALENGMVDQMGGLLDAISLAVSNEKLENYGVVTYPLEEDFWTMLRSSQSPLIESTSPTISTVLNLIPKEIKWVGNIAFAQQAVSTHLLAISPFNIDIQ